MMKHVKKLNPLNQGFRSDNARKANKSKFPDGFIYIMRLSGFDIYKIGVSNNPKRRLRDLQSANPFELKTLFCARFKDVYSLEEQLLDKFKMNQIKGEWFNAYEECVSEVITLLSNLHLIENEVDARK